MELGILDNIHIFDSRERTAGIEASRKSRGVIPVRDRNAVKK